VKKSDRDEPIQVAIHMCLKAMLVISLYSYLYLKLAKMLFLSFYLLCFVFNITGQEGRIVLPESEGGGEEGAEGRGERWPKQCIHI
jgi:hypothetical protein